MLIEVHIIQNHAPSNLNRDDSGSPKSAIFGGYRRSRISSQCLKRCYRTSKTFIEEVDGKASEEERSKNPVHGMNTRSMPDEIRVRLLAHADTLTAPEQNELQAKFKDWAEKCQLRLAAILGKEGKGGEASEQKDEDEVTESEAEVGDEEPEGAEDGRPEKADKLKTAQSIFWRENEFQALFDAYRERIEWDQCVPEDVRKSFNDKNEVKPSDMLKAVGKLNASDAFSAKAKAIYDTECAKLNGLKGKKKTEGEKRAATKLANLILDRFNPKTILMEAGLRPDGIPVDMALFGRMIASKLDMHNVEGSSQFAHAISTNEFTREFDFWTRMDDRRDKRLDWYRDAYGSERIPEGTDGMGDAEFTSACYYSYFNVDFNGLIDNLTGKALNHKLEVPQKDAQSANERA